MLPEKEAPFCPFQRTRKSPTEERHYANGFGPLGLQIVRFNAFPPWGFIYPKLFSQPSAVSRCSFLYLAGDSPLFLRKRRLKYMGLS